MRTNIILVVTILIGLFYCSIHNNAEAYIDDEDEEAEAFEEIKTEIYLRMFNF